MKLSPPIRPSESAKASPGPGRAPRRPSALLRRLRAWRWFAAIVLLPTAAVGTYYATAAADIYESEARFVVRGRQGAPSGAGALASMLGAGTAPTSEETRAVIEFIDSHDAVAELRRSLDLVSIWRRPEADALAMLRYEDPEAERLLRYYRRRVTVQLNAETGITTLRVHAFRPEDAHAIAQRLLESSENLVNRFSARSQADTLRVAREEVALAERRVIASREAVDSFRARERAVDPTRSAGAALDNIARLDSLLVQTRAELQERQSFMRADNPQVQVLRNRIAALTQQIAEERARITQGGEALPQQLSAYERLLLERTFADQYMTSAITSLEAARAEAQRQQVFLIRVVEPNRAERALYPKAQFNTITVFMALTLLYGLGWLIAAGAREHAS
jgi:capsular polysaccharide transport system permease protein